MLGCKRIVFEVMLIICLVRVVKIIICFVLVINVVYWVGLIGLLNILVFFRRCVVFFVSL